MNKTDFRKAMIRIADKMAALSWVKGMLGTPSATEGETKRVRLMNRIRKGEFLPFDSDNFERLMREMSVPG